MAIRGRSHAAYKSAPVRRGADGRRTCTKRVRSVTTSMPWATRPLMILPTAFSFPGIVREEKTTMSPGASVAVGCSSSAMRASAARDSPWLARRQSQHLVARDAVPKWSWPRNAGRPSEIAAFARHGDGNALHRAADHHHLLAVGDSRLRRSAKPRDTLDAKVVMTTRPVATPTSSERLLATSASDGLCPSRRTLVEFCISARERLHRRAL